MKRYRTIVADPPWPFKWDGRAGGRRANNTELGYETEPYEVILSLAPAHVAADATLLLWATQEALHEGWAARTARAWGFPDRSGEFIWCKPNFGTGAYPRIGHETCVIYRRGSGSLKPDAPRNVHSVQTWAQPYDGARGKKHSAKPNGFLDRVEEGFAGPYLEMFARRARFGWDYYGDESLGTAGVGRVRVLRWRCLSCSAPWATTMPGETHCPFCGAEEVSHGANRRSALGRFLPANPVESVGTSEIAPGDAVNVPGAGTEPTGGPDAG